MPRSRQSPAPKRTQGRSRNQRPCVIVIYRQGQTAQIKEPDVHIDINLLTIQPLIALIFGILILFLPRILNYLVAIYLILIGLTGLWPHLFSHLGHGT